MKKNQFSLLRTVSVFFLLTAFVGTFALNAQSVQNDLISKNIALIKSDFFSSMNLLIKGDLVLPDSAVQFEHPSNLKKAVVSWPEYDEHGNAYVIETYDYITHDKGKIEYKYGYFPYYHAIYEYSRPLEYKAYVWQDETYIVSALYKYTYDSNGKLTHQEIFLENNPTPAISCEVETKTDAQNRIISEDYKTYPGIMGMLWSYEYGANGKVSKWTTDAYAIVVGITSSSVVKYTAYNSHGLCTERILEGTQTNLLVSRTKEKMFYENGNKIVRGETWQDADLNNEFKMSTYDIFYYGGHGSGVAETKSDLSIEVYPNPTNGEFKIESSTFKVQSVEIYDVYGKKQKSRMAEKQNGEGIMVMDISNLANGIYFVEITTEKGVSVKKVVKY